MKMKNVLRTYDYDLPLMDALNDPELSPDRRVMAGATIGIGLDKAYFSVSELEEAFSTLASERERNVRHGDGYLALEEILRAKSPFQMRLWHLLDETSLDQAVSDLRWLKALTYSRGRMARPIREEGLPIDYATHEDMLDGVTAAELMAGVTEQN